MILNSFGDMKDAAELHDYEQQQLSLQLHKRENQSDEVDSRSSGEVKKQKRSSGDGASIEVVRRPRGRPPGSKNKPKPPVIINREAEPSSAMRPHVLEIPAGHDVVDSLARFSRRRNLGICVLSGTGAVANVSLRQPPVAGAPHPVPEGATVGFRGRFEILSISATFLPPTLSLGSAAANLSISLAGPQGQVVGGTVAGPLIAAETVVVVAAVFSNPTFHRLPVEEDVSVSVSVSSGEVDAIGQAEHDHDLDHDHDHDHDHDPHLHHHQPQQHLHPHHRQAPPLAPGAHAAESCAMSIYSCHLPSDVTWAFTARPPPPPPY